MHATIEAFWLPKAGNIPSEYEDAFWPRKPYAQAPFPIRLAIGDGATEASFSALWARLLVKDYGLGRLSPGSLLGRLADLQSRWRRHVGKKSLSWYAEEKMRDGAFSSLLGLTIAEDTLVHDSERRWEALAIGDSCLFQVRDEELVAGFPLDRTELFNNRPVLVSSVPCRNEYIGDALEVGNGHWEAGDVFYLMTDALACWFLKRWEVRGDPLSFLEEVHAQADFERLVNEQRADTTDDGARMLKNDDVTLVRCSIKHSE
jgi:hypothetical protein